MEEHVTPFRKVCYLDGPDGHLVWRLGTGGNIEILHLRAASPGGGAGTRMLREMLRLLQTDPPYATVFGFTRTPNVEARGFYAASGFTTFTVPGVYADGTAVLFTAPYKYLLGYHSITKE
jgi:ribosomal protein S18 acetylase RimI-like enzyme